MRLVANKDDYDYYKDRNGYNSSLLFMPFLLVRVLVAK